MWPWTCTWPFRLLFTVLALVFASVLVRLWGAAGGRNSLGELPRGPGGREGGGGRAEPAAEPSSTAAESVPQQLPAEPCKPKPQDDAGDHAALPSKAEEDDLDSKRSWW
ncbi:hypothetical protein AAES_48335 [Amazona aestiva]|uniref:Secreted protein n=1 Tax=Amazona aestiva TaxID=12930 RepID=A0A0Q3MQ20_AMAAE|nr:hypothetical protein AAES_48335 [Amazona aestiva]